jgi:hypothetical protein
MIAFSGEDERDRDRREPYRDHPTANREGIGMARFDCMGQPFEGMAFFESGQGLLNSLVSVIKVAGIIM